jgi:hypothetical protein
MFPIVVLPVVLVEELAKKPLVTNPTDSLTVRSRLKLSRSEGVYRSVYCRLLADELLVPALDVELFRPRLAVSDIFVPGLYVNAVCVCRVLLPLAVPVVPVVPLRPR